MIGVTFRYAGEIVEVRISNDKVYFRTLTSLQFSDISGLKLNKAGVLKEFPELKDEKDWKKITQERFKEKIKNMDNEYQRMQYVIDDLSKHGYKAEYLQKEGFRPVRL